MIKSLFFICLFVIIGILLEYQNKIYMNKNNKILSNYWFKWG